MLSRPSHKLVTTGLLSLLLCWFVVPEGRAQSDSWSEPAYQSSQRDGQPPGGDPYAGGKVGTSAQRLPEWAQPHDYTGSSSSGTRGASGTSKLDPDIQGAPPPPGAPIDGGLVWLTLAGAGYATKKLYDGRRDRDE